MEKLKERLSCPISDETDLELLYSFKNFPIFMGCVETNVEDDLKTNMDWYIGKQNGVIQLNPLIPLEILYKQSHGSGTVGTLWDNHHMEFAKFIKKYNRKTLLEIGSGHGKMIHNYLNLDSKSEWTVIEPNPIIKNDNRIRVIKGLFDESFDMKASVDAIVHSHVIEHLYNPIALLTDINKKITNDCLHIFSIPNLEVMIDRNYTNALNFEHTIFLTETVLEYVLKKSGFEIIEKKYFMEDHSIFYATQKTKNKPINSLINEYLKNKNNYKKYIQYHEELISDLNKKLDEIDEPVYLFGGHVFSQFLVNFGLNQDKIKFILDNDKKKQNKRLYGTTLFVKSPAIISEDKKPHIILRSGVYNDEIKSDIIENINKKTVFWT